MFVCERESGDLAQESQCGLRKALRILRTNPSETTFLKNISNSKNHLLDRGYSCNLVEKLLSEIKFTRRDSAL